MFGKLCTSLLIASACVLSSCQQVQKEDFSVIPTPVSLTEQEGGFLLKNGLRIGVSDESLLPAGEYLQGILQNAVTSTVAVGEGDINLQIGEVEGKEGAYDLVVSKEGVTAKAADYSGVVCAISTIRQMLPAGIEQPNEGAKYMIPAVTVKDAPRFAWRGMMLDAARHFWNKAEVERFIDLMALYKLNKFHWHLTDDQGWRIEIKQYPLLTEKGAWRQFNKHDRICMELAAAQDNSDLLIPEDKLKIVEGDTLYGGFYTQEEIKEVVAYAGQRGIEVIPEVDMPGHFLAAIGQYPDLACTGLIGWGEIFSSPICPGKDATLEFCKNVYKEVFQLFPSKYVHLGADEVEKNNWKKCADCQKRIKQEHLGSEVALQAWFVRNMEEFFKENGRKMIGWDEVVEDGLSNDAVIMWWRSWTPDAVSKATAQGKHVIECPNYCLYFDAQQDKNSVKQVLEFEPLSDELSAEQKELVMGVQANIWAEKIPSMKRVEYMAVPRMMALSEIAWADPDTKLKEKEFYKAAVSQLKRMDKMGVNYRIPDLQGFYNVNAFVDTTALTIHSLLPGIEIRYTTDGSIPTKNSTLYEGNLKVTETTDFTIRTFRPDGSACDAIKTKFIKKPYSEADANAQPSAAGLKAIWHDFRGDSCSLIETGRLKGEYVVETVSIPEAVKGNIGLILKGYIDVPADGVYTFALMSDDGSTMTIDGDTFLQNDGPHSPAEIIAQKALKKGLHPVEVRYFDHNGGVLELFLINEKGEKQAFPKEWLKH